MNFFSLVMGFWATVFFVSLAALFGLVYVFAGASVALLAVIAALLFILVMLTMGQAMQYPDGPERVREAVLDEGGAIKQAVYGIAERVRKIEKAVNKNSDEAEQA